MRKKKRQKIKGLEKPDKKKEKNILQTFDIII